MTLLRVYWWAKMIAKLLCRCAQNKTFKPAKKKSAPLSLSCFNQIRVWSQLTSLHNKLGRFWNCLIFLFAEYKESTNHQQFWTAKHWMSPAGSSMLGSEMVSSNRTSDKFYLNNPRWSSWTVKDNLIPWNALGHCWKDASQIEVSLFASETSFGFKIRQLQ